MEFVELAASNYPAGAKTGGRDRAARPATAVAGGGAALFDRGVICSTGTHGARRDLVEAHKWFNLAAARGHVEAGWCRADLAEEMTTPQIAEAQRRARQWVAATVRTDVCGG